MNDNELPTIAELASAYLDGELDAAERATAANDPHTMALVDSFARIRAELGSVGPVVDSTRRAAMAAALSEFDAIHAAATTAVPPPSATVTSLDTHRRMHAYRLITGVAAAAIVVVVGVAALNGSEGDSKSSSAPAATAAAALPAARKSLETAAATAAPAGGSSETFASAADSAIVALPAIDSAEALAAYAASLEAASGAGPTAAPPEAPGTAAVPTAKQVTIANAYPVPACVTSDEIVLGAISFQGTPAFAVRDSTSGTLQAIDAVDCQPLVPVAP